MAVVELGRGPGRDLGPDMDMRAITAQWVSAHTKHVAVFGRGYAIALNASLLYFVGVGRGHGVSTIRQKLLAIPSVIMDEVSVMEVFGPTRRTPHMTQRPSRGCHATERAHGGDDDEFAGDAPGHRVTQREGA